MQTIALIGEWPRSSFRLTPGNCVYNLTNPHLSFSMPDICLLFEPPNLEFFIQTPHAKNNWTEGVRTKEGEDMKHDHTQSSHDHTV